MTLTGGSAGNNQKGGGGWPPPTETFEDKRVGNEVFYMKLLLVPEDASEER